MSRESLCRLYRLGFGKSLAQIGSDVRVCLGIKGCTFEGIEGFDDVDGFGMKRRGPAREIGLADDARLVAQDPARGTQELEAHALGFGILDFMQGHVKLVPEKDRAMFSPGIVVRMKNGTTYSGEYPYERMVWNFDQLEARLQQCLPGYSLGKSGFDALVETTRGADRLPSVARIFEVTKAL